MEARASTNVLMHQDFGPRLAPYAEVLTAAGFKAGGHRMGNCCSLSASWKSLPGTCYLVTMEAIDGNPLIKGSLAYLPKVSKLKETELHWLFCWMRLDTPADLTRLLSQCIELDEAQKAFASARKYLYPLKPPDILSHTSYWQAGFDASKSKH